MDPQQPQPADRAGSRPSDRSASDADRVRERRLEERVRELEFERDGYYAEWQHAKNRLAEIHASRTWQLVAALLDLGHPLRRPRAFLSAAARLAGGTALALARLVLWLPGLALGAAAAAGGRVARVVARVAGRVYLVAWCWGAELAARLRPRRPVAPPVPPAPPVPAGGRRPRVLIVSPYHLHPADHGGGVRLSNLVRELSRSCDLYLLIFSQRGEDPEQRSALEPYCARVDFHHWRPRLDPDPLGLEPPNAQLFASDRASAKIRDIVHGHAIDVVQLEYTELAQYRRAVPPGVPVIVTEHDVAFRSFARRRALGFHHRFPEGGAFGSTRADARRLMRHEILACRAVDQLHMMSASDAEFLAPYLGDGADRMVVAPNGVDTASYREPSPPLGRSGVLYVGNYQNLPNVDALEHLALDIWPLLRLRRPDARLTVVGANPSDRVLRFDGRDGIAVVGPVDDLRDAYHGHRVMAAPIRAGSGTRLKILEAFAAGIPVVATTLAAEGIAAEGGRHLLIADTAVELAAAIERLLDDDELAGSLAAAAAELVRDAYDWRIVADTILGAYHSLIPAGRPAAATTRPAAVGGSDVEVSIVIPTLDGGDHLDRCLEAIGGQATGRRFEVICVDSGSRESDLETMRRHGARIVPIDRRDFNHGLTRDLGAGLGRGGVVVFLNQDAVPADDGWLEALVAPFDDDEGRLAAVQGGIAEVPDPDDRFYWDSCGERFYFTSESKGWIEAHGGIGFSTVNCAIRRPVWERYPFGFARIMEDKKWQREVVEAGLTIVARPEALVRHTHVYDGRGLLRRCASEGYGWRALGEPYRLGDMLRDMGDRATLRDLARGLHRRRIRTPAELLFPWLRPAALYWGNRVARDVRL
ncbi:MAG: glycosyltransferase [Thermoanaerobaculales bacterium]|nr:glycosyltransferase [Thermoanaerobaculales bacterium]